MPRVLQFLTKLPKKKLVTPITHLKPRRVSPNKTIKIKHWKDIQISPIENSIQHSFDPAIKWITKSFFKNLK